MIEILFFGLLLVTVPIWSSFADLGHKPLHQQNVIRAASGLGMIVMAIYLTMKAEIILDGPYWNRLSLDASWQTWVPAAVPAALFVTGVLWFSVYIKRTHDGDRHIIGVAWSAVQIAGSVALLLWLYRSHILADYPQFEVLVTASALWWLVTNIVKFLLYARGPRRPSLDEVATQQAHGRGRAASEDEATRATTGREAPRRRRFDS